METSGREAGWDSQGHAGSQIGSEGFLLLLTCYLTARLQTAFSVCQLSCNELEKELSCGECQLLPIR